MSQNDINIVLVDRYGSIKEDAACGSLPSKWSWALGSISRIQEELKHTNDDEKNLLKQKLVRVFRQHNGRLILTDTNNNLADLYRNDEEQLILPTRRAFAWLMKKMPDKNTEQTRTGYFRHQYKQDQPQYRIVFNAQAYPDGEQKFEMPSESIFGDLTLRTMRLMPALHELTHAAVAAGHHLATSSNKAYKETLVKTKTLKLLKTVEETLFSGSTSTVKFYFANNYNNYPDSWEDEVLAYASGDFFSKDIPDTCPLIGSFITHILSYNLDLILNQDRVGYKKLLTALDNETFFLSKSELGNMLDPLKNGDIEERRAARDNLVLAIDDIMKQTIIGLKAKAGITSKLVIG